METSLKFGTIFLFVGTILFGIRVLIYQHKLYHYLLKHHTEKWKKLTTVFGFGPGLANGLRGMKFLYSKDYLDDSEVLRLKVIIRNSFILTLGGMFATLFWSFIVDVIIQSNK